MVQSAAVSRNKSSLAPHPTNSDGLRGENVSARCSSVCELSSCFSVSLQMAGCERISLSVYCPGVAVFLAAMVWILAVGLSNARLLLLKRFNRRYFAKL